MPESDWLALAIGAIATVAVVTAVVTAPIWIPMLFGQGPSTCRCGAVIRPSGIAPECTCTDA